MITSKNAKKKISRVVWPLKYCKICERHTQCQNDSPICFWCKQVWGSEPPYVPTPEEEEPVPITKTPHKVYTLTKADMGELQRQHRATQLWGMYCEHEAKAAQHKYAHANTPVWQIFKRAALKVAWVAHEKAQQECKQRLIELGEKV